LPPSVPIWWRRGEVSPDLAFDGEAARERRGWLPAASRPVPHGGCHPSSHLSLPIPVGEARLSKHVRAGSRSASESQKFEVRRQKSPFESGVAGVDGAGWEGAAAKPSLMGNVSRGGLV